MSVLIALEDYITLNSAPGSRAIYVSSELEKNNVETILLGGYTKESDSINLVSDIRGIRKNYKGKLGIIMYRLTYIFELLKILYYEKVTSSIIRGRRSSILWIIILKIFNIRILFDFHGYSYSLNNKTNKKFIPQINYLRDIFCLSFSNYVIAQNNYNLKKVESFNSNTILLRNGVNLDLFQPRSSLKKLSNNFLSTYKIPNDKILIGFVANEINEWMDLGCMLDATSYYSKDIHFVLIGGENKTKYLQKSNYKNVTFIGNISNIEVSIFLNKIDIGVYAINKFLSEDCWGSPRKIGEWISMGIPIVVTKMNPSPFYLEDGKNVFYCEAQNPLNLAQKVNHLAKDYKIRSTMKDYNMSIRNNLSWSKSIKDSAIVKLLS